LLIENTLEEPIFVTALQILSDVRFSHQAEGTQTGERKCWLGKVGMDSYEICLNKNFEELWKLNNLYGFARL